MVSLSRTATAERRSAPWVGATTTDPLGLVLLALVYVKSYFSFSPFSKPSVDAIDTVSSGGSAINQVMWLALMAFAGIVIFRNLGTALALLCRIWPIFLPLGWFAITILWTLDSAVTLRRVVLICVVAAVAFGVAAARPSAADVLKVSLVVLGAILFLSVLSVFAVPHLARSGGNFIGIYEHKNTAGAVSAVVFVFWLFAVFWIRQFEFKVICLFGASLWLVFLIGTFSKTSIGGAALASLLGIGLYNVMRLAPIWRVIAYVATGVFACFAVWLGLLFNLTLEDVGLFIFEDLTFTNRTYLWTYVWRSIEESYWLGHGYGAFWYAGAGTPNRLDADPGWAANATSAHNGYLNIWLEAGFVGLALCGLTILLAVRGAFALLRDPAAPTKDRWVYAVLLAQLILVLGHNLLEANLFKSNASSSFIFFAIFFLIEMWRQEIRERETPTFSAEAYGPSR